MSNNERVNKVDIHKDFYDGRKKSFLYFKFCTNSNFTKKKLMETEVLGGKPSRYFCKKKCLKIIFK